jgi:hypothetical protein
VLSAYVSKARSKMATPKRWLQMTIIAWSRNTLNINSNNNSDCSREYRGSYLQYCERNRLLQELREAKRRAQRLAKKQYR